MNQIILVGANHTVAPVRLRERLAFGPEGTAAALRELLALLACPPGLERPEVVMLCTCNRTEVYAYAPGQLNAAQEIRGYLLGRGGAIPGDPEGLAGMLYSSRGQAAALHLMEVAAGLGSMVTGENEILGQVKDAYGAAHNAGTAGPVLSALFRHAVQAGKRVRTETEIGRTALSLATVVVELAAEGLGSLADRTALLIGAGKMGSLVAHALVRAGLRCVLVANRTYSRAQALAERLGGKAVNFDALPEHLAAADVVICSTCAPHLVLHVPEVQAAMQEHPDRPLLVIDLAVPRDADPAIATVGGVRLADIDDLDGLVRARHPMAATVRQDAMDIVGEGVADFGAWYAARECVPAIRALRARADAICEVELARTLPRLGDLTPRQKQAVEAMAHAIAQKLLHDPVTQTKAPPPGCTHAESIAWLRLLFALDAAEPRS